MLGLEKHWDINLNTIEGMTDLVTHYVEKIDKYGVKKALEEVK